MKVRHWIKPALQYFKPNFLSTTVICFRQTPTNSSYWLFIFLGSFNMLGLEFFVVERHLFTVEVFVSFFFFFFFSLFFWHCPPIYPNFKVSCCLLFWQFRKLFLFHCSYEQLQTSFVFAYNIFLLHPVHNDLIGVIPSSI